MADVGAHLGVTSSDFVDGGYLDTRHSANARGQCHGANLSPQLTWDGAPADTVTFAITAIDLSAGDWVHWVHANIPATVTSAATGASSTLPGVAGVTGAGTTGYFGPCPPGPDHKYEFTVWALDSILTVPNLPTFAQFVNAAASHVLAQGTIVGLYFERKP